MSTNHPAKASHSSHPLLERSAQLDELESVLEDAREGRGAIVFLSGNAGIGKTALVREFARRAGDGARVYVGACDALSTQEPLAPLFDIMNEVDPETRERIQTAGSRLTRFQAFLSMFDDRSSPALVIFEDVHWADEATLDLLRFAGRRIESTRAMLVATYRNDEAGAGHPLRVLLGDLASLGSSRRMTLPPLTRDGVGILAAGSDVDPDDLHQLTGGNPFFATEVLASGGGVPATVRDAVLARASRLSSAGRGALEAAAVIGSPGEIWLLGAMIDAGHQAIDECIQAGMLVATGDSFSFRHEIARQAILSSIPPGRTSSLHGRALDHLEGAPAGRSKLARLAHHADASGRSDAVLRYAPEAARSASRLNAHREAAAQFQRALRHAGGLEPEDRAALLEAFAHECYLTDRMDDAIEARRAAIEIWHSLGRPVKAGENLYRMARVLVLAGQNAAAEQASQEAIATLEQEPPGPDLASAYQIQAHLRMLDRDNAEAIERGMAAIALAERHGALEAMIYAHNTVGSAMILSGRNEGREYLERSVDLAEEAGLDDYVASAIGNLGSASGEIYLFKQADAYLERGIAYCEERDLDFDRNYMLAWQALSHFHQGRWNQAGAVAASLLRRPYLAAISRIMAQIAIGRIRARRGDPEVMPMLDEALNLARQTATLQRLGPVHAARAEAAWLTGDARRAAEEARSAYDLALRQAHPWLAGELAYWLWKAGDLDSVPAFIAEPYRQQINGDWEAAAASWRALDCHYEAARALAESNDEDSVKRALSEFANMGASPARAAAAQRLRELGSRGIPRGPRPATLAHPAGLTPRQQEIADLLAAGLTNAEIAARLFISPKTVENHITALFAKLDVATRAEAIGELNRIEESRPN